MSKNRSQVPSMDQLKHVEQSNRDAQSSAAQKGDLTNFSSGMVANNEKFDTARFEIATQAAAVGRAKHLDLIGQINSPERIAATRNAYSAFSEELHSVRLPNTRVNIANKDIEIPVKIKEDAEALPQAVYIRYLEILLGDDRMFSLYEYMKKANQATQPALWFNQHLAVELRQPYVFLLHREFPEHFEQLEGLMNVDFIQMTEGQICDILGPDLYDELSHAGKSNNTCSYAVLTALADRIIANYDKVSKPVHQLSMWDSIRAKKKAKQDEKDNATPDLTAERIVELQAKGTAEAAQITGTGPQERFSIS